MNLEKLADDVSPVAMHALLSAHLVYRSLSPNHVIKQGKTRTRRAPFLEYITESCANNAAGGEAVFRKAAEVSSGESVIADIEPETAIVNMFRASRVPIVFESEELGVTYVCCSQANPGNKFGAIDGLDGTSDFMQNGPFSGRQSTMFGIWESANPRYEDYLFSGIVEHAQRVVYFAQRGRGAYSIPVSEMLSGDWYEHLLRPLQGEVFDKNAVIQADLNFDPWAKISVIEDSFVEPLAAAGHTCTSPLASSAIYADVARGMIHLGLECTRGHRKPSLEPAIAYGLLREAGGVLVDYTGRDLGDKRYWEYGRGQDEFFPIIAGANEALVHDFVTFLHQGGEHA